MNSYDNLKERYPLFNAYFDYMRNSPRMMNLAKEVDGKWIIKSRNFSSLYIEATSQDAAIEELCCVLRSQLINSGRDPLEMLDDMLDKLNAA